jgi:hypothetical protein
MAKFMSRYESMTRKQQMFIFVLVLMPIFIPIEAITQWPYPMKVLLAVENLFAAFLVGYEFRKLLKRKKI